MENPGHCLHIVKDDAVCDQVVVFDEFPLLVAVIFSDGAITAERQPFRELIEVLAQWPILSVLSAVALVEAAIASTPTINVVESVSRPIDS